MQHLGTVPLRTSRLILRRMSLDDCHAMFAHWAGNPAATRFLRWDAHRDWTVTAEFLHFVAQQYADSTFYQWGICLADGTLIGSISLQPEERTSSGTWRQIPASLCTDPLWETGYVLGPRWWGQGYATEALAAVLDFWFLQVHASVLTACHALANPASGRVMEKCGFRYDHDTTSHRYNGASVPCRAYCRFAPAIPAATL